MWGANSIIAGLPANAALHRFEKEIALCEDKEVEGSNVWDMKIIDIFSDLIHTHHQRLKNLQIIGPPMDAITTVYGMRVDSLHKDVVRIARSLLSSSSKRRQTESPDNSRSGGDDEAQANEDVNVSKPGKKRRKRNNRSNIVKDKSTINGRLELIPMPDPVMSKIKETRDDLASSSHLFLSTLQTKSSDLKLTASEKFWDDYEYEPIVFKSDDDYGDDDHIELPKAIITDGLTLRQSLVGYRITDREADDSDPGSQISQHSYGSPGGGSIDAFDFDVPDNIGADFDPETAENASLNEVENAVDTSNRSVSTIGDILDMQPTDANRLEYSYVPTGPLYKNFWAGPSYWKPLPRAIPVGRVPKTRTRKVHEMLTFEDLENFRSDKFLPLQSKEAKKIRECNYANWAGNAKKNTFPKRIDIPPTLFKNYVYLLNKKTEYQDEESDVAGNDDFEDFSGAPFESANQSIDDIELYYEGAPEQIATNRVNFEGKEKVIDMNRLKTVTWEAIEQQFESTKNVAHSFEPEQDEEYENGFATFSGIHKHHRQTLPQKMQEHLSPSLAIFSALSLCSEKLLRLQTTDPNELDSEFVVRQLKQ